MDRLFGSKNTRNPEKISLKVYYNQDSEFVISSVSGDGSNSPQSEGTAADPANGRMVILDDIMEKEVFKADKIAILQFDEP